MRFVTAVPTGDGSGITPLAGVLAADQVVSLGPLGYPDVLSVIEAGRPLWDRLRADPPVGRRDGVDRWPRSALELLAPVPRPPRNVFAVGTNYSAHFDEGVRPRGSGLPNSPVFFTKPWTCLNGDGGPIVVDPAVSEQVDWEAEIAVVIGIGGRDIARADALDHVFGFCLANDVSARDLQLANPPFTQWFKGKSLDGYCPLGPALVTLDEVVERVGLDGIEVELTVNGATKQKLISRDMHFDVPAIIERLSAGMTLLPGDVILTGTTSGVGYWRDPKEFLRPGDEVVITSNVLGRLRSPVVGPRPASVAGPGGRDE
jgi:2-keto-4-pentenoate hydratase/2-oxohepta-3-ene-1,7-dioic acid hydratase in catechol pathway